ncbi:MAG: hypothetical protein WA958_20020 [Tunicatimonas sp.]
MKLISFALYTLLFSSFLLFSSCVDDDVPPEENEEETITNVTLTFTPSAGGTAVTATWVDADGEGVNPPALTPISLTANTTYTLTIDLLNAIDPSDPESITEEIEEEDDEHMFFFGWTNGLFSSPTGDGNLGAGNRRADAVNYEDEDDAGFPLGLETTWTTGDATTGTFRVVLKHQPDIKSATSDSTNGESDVDIIWEATVQ